MATPRRVAPKKRPGGVARRSFSVTKLLSSRLARTFFGQQRGDRVNVNRP
jgi:hypothetical protein